MSDTTFRLGYGKANLSNQVGTYSPMRLKPPYLQDSAVTSGRRSANSTQTYPVSANHKINGNMYITDVAHPDGTIIMLKASIGRGATRLYDGSILLRIREYGPLLNITAKMPQGHDNLLGDRFMMFTGRADILSVEEAAVFQINIPRGVVNSFFNIDEVNALFQIDEIASEARPKPEAVLVSTSTGLVTREIPVEPVRRMKIRK